MAFSRRMAALSAVVLIPLGIAATSFALADSPQSPKVPSQRVELDSGSPTPTRTPASTPAPDRSGTAPGDEVVSRPPVTDSPTSGDDDDDRGQGAGDDGPGDDDGPGTDN
ncbi:hypothetical protein GCM10027074_02850 [Streptomyces deserti]